MFPLRDVLIAHYRRGRPRAESTQPAAQLRTLDHNSCRLAEKALKWIGSPPTTRLGSTMCKCTLYIYVPIINAVLLKLLQSGMPIKRPSRVSKWENQFHLFIDIQPITDLRNGIEIFLVAPPPFSTSTGCPSVRVPTPHYYWSPIEDALLPLKQNPIWVLVPTAFKGEDLSILATDLIWFSQSTLFITGQERISP